MDFYVPWFIVWFLVYFAGLFLLLKYYQFQTYRFAYYSGIVAAFVLFCYAIVIYKSLTSTEMMYNSLFFTTLIATLISGAIYSFSLIVPPAGEKRWLKNAGIASLIYSLIIFSIVVFDVLFPTNPIKTTLSGISNWVAIFGNVIPILILKSSPSVTTCYDAIPMKNKYSSIYGIIKPLASKGLVYNLNQEIG